MYAFSDRHRSLFQDREYVLIALFILFMVPYDVSCQLRTFTISSKHFDLLLKSCNVELLAFFGQESSFLCFSSPTTYYSSFTLTETRSNDPLCIPFPTVMKFPEQLLRTTVRVRCSRSIIMVSKKILCSFIATDLKGSLKHFLFSKFTTIVQHFDM